ncbi:MAG TPA: serine hydrolase [Blastocatellia bacterium]|nr:serine hydrolase [Blastocatellia bacterium]
MEIRRLIFVLVLAVILAGGPVAQQWPTQNWPTAKPGDVGLDAKTLDGLDAEIAAGKFGNIDSMLVIRHGKLVFDRAYKHDYGQIYGKEAKEAGALNASEMTGPYNYFSSWWHPFYRRGDLHTMQSVTKTVTSVVIGTATTNGEFPPLDTPILKFFDAAKVANVDERKRRITIRNLLTMTGGFDWNEQLPYNDPNNSASRMEASFNWVDFVINLPMAREPGTLFNYSSGESELLAHIFHVATGKDIEEYAATHLFAPLGIKDFYWKRSPYGLIDTEGGLYLRAHDLAKIWFLFLKNGIWEGKQIVSADWVKESVKPAVPVGNGGAKYGLKWWLFPYGDGTKLAWAGSGFGGQMPIVVPEHDLVLVLTGWNVLPGSARLGHRAAIDRVVAAIKKEPSAGAK